MREQVRASPSAPTSTSRSTSATSGASVSPRPWTLAETAPPREKSSAPVCFCLIDHRVSASASISAGHWIPASTSTRPRSRSSDRTPESPVVSTSVPPAQNCWPPIAWRPPHERERRVARRGPANGRLQLFERPRPHDLRDRGRVQAGVDVVDELAHSAHPNRRSSQRTIHPARHSARPTEVSASRARCLFMSVPPPSASAARTRGAGIRRPLRGSAGSPRGGAPARLRRARVSVRSSWDRR